MARMCSTTAAARSSSHAVVASHPTHASTGTEPERHPMPTWGGICTCRLKHARACGNRGSCAAHRPQEPKHGWSDGHARCAMSKRQLVGPASHRVARRQSSVMDSTRMSPSSRHSLRQSLPRGQARVACHASMAPGAAAALSRAHTHTYKYMAAALRAARPGAALRGRSLLLDGQEELELRPAGSAEGGKRVSAALGHSEAQRRGRGRRALWHHSCGTWAWRSVHARGTAELCI